MSKDDFLKGVRGTAIVLVEALFISAIVLLFVCPISCRFTSGAVDLITSDYESPRLERFCVDSSRSMRFSFSRPVTMTDVSVYPLQTISSVEYEYASSESESPSSSSSACFVNLKFSEPLSVGSDYTIFGCVKDVRGNSLSFCLPFSGFNENPARLKIIEVHPKYQGESKGNCVFKNEYVLFKVEKAGNLSSLVLESAYAGGDKAYKFPSVFVKEGELVAVHLRSKGSGCISELSEDLSLSKAYYSLPEVRDLWDENVEARLGDDTDVLVLYEAQSKTMMDAFLYASTQAVSGGEWKKASMREYAVAAFEEGLWEAGPEIEAAFISDGITATKSFIRRSDENSPFGWEVGSSTLR